MNNRSWFGLFRVWVLCAGLALGVAACAIDPVVFHSVSIVNKSSATVRKGEIIYGDETIRFSNVYRTSAGSTKAGERKVPNQLTVSWETDTGEVKRETVPLRLNGIGPRGLAALKLQFTDQGIELYQGVDPDKQSRYFTRIHP